MEHGLTVGHEFLALDGLGSNPSAPALMGPVGQDRNSARKIAITWQHPFTRIGDMAQLVAHLRGTQKVLGSSPSVSTGLFAVRCENHGAGRRLLASRRGKVVGHY